MAPDVLKRAIEPFFTTKGQGKGTGLGLSMVHGLAAQSGGALRLTSRIGEGTTAELWLPLSQEIVEEQTRLRTETPGTGRRAKVLLVDDEKLVRSATAEMLRDQGHEVIETGSPSAALAYLHSDASFDLLITDHVMRRCAAARLRRRAIAEAQPAGTADHRLCESHRSRGRRCTAPGQAVSRIRPAI